MKTFEERYTAYLDGLLNEREAAIFEQEQPALAAKKTEWLKLRGVLRDNLVPVELTNADFFNAELLRQIAQAPVPDRAPATGRRWFGIPRLAWGGLGALAAGTALFVVLIPHGDLSDPGSGYVAEVLKTTTIDPKVSATVESGKGITIIKLEGLEKVPADEDLTH
jgi:anti-sigma factor RsiW